MRCAVVVACSKLTQLQDELSASIERYERAEDRAAKAEKELGTVKVR
jgi:exonuclease VII small subunit